MAGVQLMLLTQLSTAGSRVDFVTAHALMPMKQLPVITGRSLVNAPRILSGCGPTVACRVVAILVSGSHMDLGYP